MEAEMSEQKRLGWFLVAISTLFLMMILLFAQASSAEAPRASIVPKYSPCEDTAKKACRKVGCNYSGKKVVDLTEGGGVDVCVGICDCDGVTSYTMDACVP
jgi:hypothetical protein